jgi:hypothetical protein
VVRDQPSSRGAVQKDRVSKDEGWHLTMRSAASRSMSRGRPSRRALTRPPQDEDSAPSYVGRMERSGMREWMECGETAPGFPPLSQGSIRATN